MPEIEDEVIEQEESEEQVEQKTEPELILGKFKSTEDLEKAYKELEKKLGQREEPQYVAAPEYQTTENANDPNYAWFENPNAAFEQKYMQLRQYERQVEQAAKYNVRQAMKAFKGDQAYNLVAEDFQDELERLDPSMLANPQQAQLYAENIYNVVVGRMYRSKREPARSDPNERKRVLASLGVEDPDAEPTPTKKDDVSNSDIEMLRALGLSGAKVKNTVKRLTEEE